jgi:hypothetical protein
VDYLLRRLARAGLRRGMAGEHWAWLAIAGAAFLLRRSRRQADAVVLSRAIRPGERYLVTLSDPKAPTGPPGG